MLKHDKSFKKQKGNWYKPNDNNDGENLKYKQLIYPHMKETVRSVKRGTK